MASSSNRSQHLVDVKSASPARLERIATEYKSLCKQAADIEIRKKELSAKLLRLTKVAGEEAEDGKIRASTDSWDLVIVDSSNSQLDPKKLMQLGVSARIIKKATVKKEYSYVLATAKQGDSE